MRIMQPPWAGIAAWSRLMFLSSMDLDYPMSQAERATCSTTSTLPLSSEGPAPSRLLSEVWCLDDCVAEAALACTSGITH
jgi:hypothetical protein